MEKHSWAPSERHLLIYGFVLTGPPPKGRAEKPRGTRPPEQAVGFVTERLTAEDLYIFLQGRCRPQANRLNEPPKHP
jgi:hypothetical protein